VPPGEPPAAIAGQQNPRRPGVADVDVLLLSPNEIYVLGKTIGSTNVVLLDRSGTCTAIDIAVGLDTAAVTASLNELLPSEPGIKVSAAADSLVLSGVVSDATAAERAVDLASAYVRRVTGGNGGQRNDRVVNMLSVSSPQQVMLEVKVAEISKVVLDQFGINFARAYSPADGSLIRFLSGLFGGEGLVGGHIGGTTDGSVGAGMVGSSNNGRFTTGTTAPAGSGTADGSTIPIAMGKNTTTFGVNAQKKDGLVKVLAEPTVMAISGQEGSFLAGGKIFIPVAQTNNNGTTQFTLQEKEFGVSLRFTPTVLGDGRINLAVNPEVSELNPQGVGITAPGVSGMAILPSFTTRRAATTVQLFDGQSFAIGGLIKNNVTTNIQAFPILGELPILGALFRSSDFQTDRSELVFVITPRLVKPLPPNYALPTDSYVQPSRGEFFLGGRMEGKPKKEATPPAQPAPAPSQPEASGQGGFEVR
jgi:pilus assembly protein CpaC